MTKAQQPRSREWRHSLLLAVAALMATALFLQVDGTLASWTRAALTNNTNTAASGSIVVLRSSLGVNACRSDSSTANTSICSSINVYGGETSAIYPGQFRTIDISFTNTGTMAASRFALIPSACTSQPTVSGFTPANLCTSGDLLVAVACNPGPTYQPSLFWSDLRRALLVPPTEPLVHSASPGELAVGASWHCRIHIEMPSSASQNAQGVQVSQQFEWMLRA